jgi:hypothetical protein
VSAEATIPDVFYVFVNMLDPRCFHNVTATKRLTSAAMESASLSRSFRAKYLDGSADYFPFVHSKPDCVTISAFCRSAVNDYVVEYQAELVRRKFFPLLPSRFSAVFAFGDRETCEAADAKYHWGLDSVREFRLQRDSLTRICRVNMEIISLMRGAGRRAFFNEKETESVSSHYWRGGGSLAAEVPAVENGKEVRKTYPSGVIWEYLIEGALELIDKRDDTARPEGTPGV